MTRSRTLTLVVALTLCATALIAAGCGDDGDDTTSVAAEEATTESTGPDPETCVDAWNEGANAAAQQELVDLFADGGSGNVVVGSEEGACVLAANNTTQPEYVACGQDGDAFTEAGGGPGDEFNGYRETIGPLNVILQPSGSVEVAP